MFNYPVSVEQDDVTGQFVVSCRDLPLMNSVGDTLDDALLQSVDAMVVAIAIEVDERRPIPQASAALPGEYVVSLPVLVAMKAALHNAMIETGTRKAELARKLGQKGPQIDRLLDVEHSSKVETVELALHQLNRQIDLTITQQHRT
ncbi:type II toxin-antitoxin system HicB family antitoxin [Kosakonia sp. ML.JS2a]|uniref:type II toxin-antitoxin system HicB family antitoxin n=1 Tax=Kosakonia sp. ML.JS2a TaxID=2980557 RepID=UPI0021DA7C1C|nr:type II toxin-antitoxin system HicB family antitoxin [Kosakonia sp. ML.JS2a]UXY10402.1 type II toxin-antitoxin system HicB family antitoxin [Kosakonia sp. ML.JS2a]